MGFDISMTIPSAQGTSFKSFFITHNHSKWRQKLFSLFFSQAALLCLKLRVAIRELEPTPMHKVQLKM